MSSGDGWLVRGANTAVGRRNADAHSRVMLMESWLAREGEGRGGGTSGLSEAGCFLPGPGHGSCSHVTATEWEAE